MRRGIQGSGFVLIAAAALTGCAPRDPHEHHVMINGERVLCVGTRAGCEQSARDAAPYLREKPNRE